MYAPQDKAHALWGQLARYAGSLLLSAAATVVLCISHVASAAEPKKPETPKIDNKTNCIEQYRNVCRKVNTRKCRVVMREDCAMRPTNRCRDKLVERCTPSIHQVCQTIGGRRHCRQETRRNCRKVIRQVCDRRLQRRCKRVPKTVCTNEPETRCVQRRFYACTGQKPKAKSPAKK